MFFNQIETHFIDSSFEIKEMGSINKSHVWQEQFSVWSRDFVCSTTRLMKDINLKPSKRTNSTVSDNVRAYK